MEKVNPAGLRALKDKKIILIYGVRRIKIPIRSSLMKRIADKDGGLALLANGNVKKVSADQVKAAAKTNSIAVIPLVYCSLRGERLFVNEGQEFGPGSTFSAQSFEPLHGLRLAWSPIRQRWRRT